METNNNLEEKIYKEISHVLDIETSEIQSNIIYQFGIVAFCELQILEYEQKAYASLVGMDGEEEGSALFESHKKTYDLYDERIQAYKKIQALYSQSIDTKLKEKNISAEKKEEIEAEVQDWVEDSISTQEEIDEYLKEKKKYKDATIKVIQDYLN